LTVIGYIHRVHIDLSGNLYSY